MRIESTQLSYVAVHRSASVTGVIDETLARPRISGRQAVATSSSGASLGTADTVEFSQAAGSSAGSDGGGLGDLNAKEFLALLIIETLAGHKINIYRSPSCAAAKTAIPSASSAATAGAVYQRTELHAEMEQTRFQAQGVVETADGRSIHFSAELTMQREFTSRSVTTGTVATTDPLVVNTGGLPAQVTGAKIGFDLNSDGKLEDISFVTGGSGFLALDSNGDGIVNDGRELFGPKTGNGFGELASYDSDGNGWIDESDPVFAKLRIWSEDGLSTLQEKGIGAISTSSVATPFALKDAANVLQAEIRSSGIYLSESGAAGTIQQVDLVDG
jgi:hypothetical protein